MTSNEALQVRAEGAESDGISVVVPTYNASSLLRPTLDSLCAQRMERLQYEVIVVDDGSSDDTARVVRGYEDRADVSYFFQPDRGFRVAAARNVGIARARFPIVLFVDAGIVVSSRVLGMHAAAHRGDPNAVVLGLSYGVLEFDNPRSSVIANTAGLGADQALAALRTRSEVNDCRYAYLASIGFDLTRMPAPWLICWGGHVSARTRTLRAIGGFDEWFHRWGGEDVELGLRLAQHGCRYQVLTGTESIHYPHPKCASAKQRDSHYNALYIHRKHRLAATKLLAHYGWEAVVARLAQMDSRMARRSSTQPVAQRRRDLPTAATP